MPPGADRAVTAAIVSSESGKGNEAEGCRGAKVVTVDDAEDDDGIETSEVLLDLWCWLCDGTALLGPNRAARLCA